MTHRIGANRPIGWCVAVAAVTAALVAIAVGGGAPFAAAAPPSPGASFPAGFQAEVVFSGLSFPTQVVFSPDGRVFVTEKYGTIKVFDGLGDSTPTLFADLTDEVYRNGDRGLIGLALDPQFPAVPDVYVGYSYDAPPGQTAPVWNDVCPTPPGQNTDGCVSTSRVSRLVADGDTWTGTETVLLHDWCQQFGSHSIAGMTFGPDGALYVAGGEGASYNAPDYGQFGGWLAGTPTPANPCGDPPTGLGVPALPPNAEGGALRAQDLRTSGDPTGLDGAVIRIDPATGDALPDNPGAANSDENARRVIAYGLRNPYTLKFRPGTDELWIGDVGWAQKEEIDRIDGVTTGIRNFGWPCYEGFAPQASYQSLNLAMCSSLYAPPATDVTPPVFEYSHGGEVVPGDGCAKPQAAITGLAFYNGGSLAGPPGNYPAHYDGALFFTDYPRGCIWAMLPGADGTPDPSTVELFASGLGTTQGAATDLEVGPGGDLYYADLWTGKVWRIRYYPGNRPPQPAVTADPSGGSLPLDVQFDASESSDADGDALTFAWDLDADGRYDDSTSPNPTYQYTSAGNVDVGVEVTDALGASATASISVTPGNRAPTIDLTAPGGSGEWSVGSDLPFAATATDPDTGDLSPSSFEWSLDLHHCATLTACHTHPVEGRSGVASGSFTAPDHGYPAYLTVTATATDPSGLSTSASIDLYPSTTTLEVLSDPPGLVVNVNEDVESTPVTRTVIVGSSNFVAAPAQAMASTAYGFDGWSDAGAQAHSVVVGTPTTLTATFSPRTIAIGDVEVIEGTGGITPATATVSLNAPNTDSVTVDWATTSGTAAAPGDFAAASGTVTFEPGETSKQIVLDVVADAADESDEAFGVVLSNPVRATLADATALTTIRDDDNPALATTSGTFYEGNAGQVGVWVPVTLSSPSAVPVTVDWTTVPDSATAPSDYVSASGQLSFAPGEMSKNVVVAIKGDVADENDERLFVRLSDAVGATLPAADATVTIVDDDGPVGAPALVGLVGRATERDNGTFAISVPVMLTAPSAQTVSARWTSIPYSATPGIDLPSPQTGTVSFVPGSTSATVDLIVDGDILDEDDEYVFLRFDQIANASLGGFKIALVKIIDDEGPPGAPALFPFYGAVTEGNGGTRVLDIPVLLTAPSSSTVRAGWWLTPSSAYSGTDFVDGSGTVVFAPGTTVSHVFVTVVGDMAPEPDELFIVNFEGIENASLGGYGIGIGIITNDD